MIDKISVINLFILKGWSYLSVVKVKKLSNMEEIYDLQSIVQ